MSLCGRFLGVKMTQKQIVRREKISFMLTMGYKEEDIAKELKVSRRTIVRDVKYLRDSYKKWGMDKLKNDLMFEARLGLDLFKNMRLRLFDLLEEATTIKEKLNIIQEIQSNCVGYLNNLYTGPVIRQVEDIVSARIPRDIDSDNTGDSKIPGIPDHVVEMYTNKE